MITKPQVLMVSRPAVGGMKIHLKRLIEGLSDEYEIQLAGPENLLQDLGIYGYALDIPDRLSPFKLPGLVNRLSRIIRKTRPQIVHAHGYVAGTVAALTTPIMRVPVTLCTLHNLFPSVPAKAARKALQICGRSSTRLIAITQAVKKSVEVMGIPSEKMVIIPNGIDLSPYNEPYDIPQIRQELQIPADAPCVLAVARLIPSKGIIFLLQAAPALIKALPNIRILVAGDGPQRKELEEQTKSMGLTESIRFLGERHDIPKLLAACDVLAVPSLAEGQSLIVLEGMASRRPVVASDVGGMREMIQDGETGLLIRPADPVCLADTLQVAFNSKSLVKKLSENGRSFVESEMTLDKMIDRTKELYEKLLNS